MVEFSTIGVAFYAFLLFIIKTWEVRFSHDFSKVIFFDRINPMALGADFAVLK
jgi:hypothetical protein